MPKYDFQCLKCDKEFEDFAKIADRLDVKCPDCKGETKILMSPPYKDWFKPFWHEHISEDGPVFVKSKDHFRELCRKHGVYAPHHFGQGYNIKEV